MKDKLLISYCGLYCGDCFIRKCEIADLAKELSEKLNQVHFEQYAEGLSNIISEFKPLSPYKKFFNALCSLDGLRCQKYCKQGGGSTSCKIRICCQKKNIEGCWQCEQFEDCEILAWLKPVNGDANIKNIRKIKTKGISKFIEDISSKE